MGEITAKRWEQAIPRHVFDAAAWGQSPSDFLVVVAPMPKVQALSNENTSAVIFP
ncbi:MAG TPA: hypothetical protein VMA74_16820 [Dyella sp.]|uniref:hypothetical protein n=1 Tax=Dyella sp. TaxID=1869338 RepID=UPI002B5076C2|nr:hypothetical protein [Dyella sp.]HUB91388.1 hypothetical protein [Dyella sp.]